MTADGCLQRGRAMVDGHEIAPTSVGQSIQRRIWVLFADAFDQTYEKAEAAFHRRPSARRRDLIRYIVS